jgi:pimeloyl-ACP methyl ester carboxylesterase
MKSLLTISSALVVVTALALAPAEAGARGKAKPKSKERESGAAPAEEKVLDQGGFVFSMAGRRAGRETFTLVEIGNEREIRTTTELEVGSGAPSLVRGTLRTDEKWRPLHGRFDWQSQGLKKRITLKRSGEFPELATESSARSIVHTRPQKDSDLMLLRTPEILSHFLPFCRMAGEREQTLTAFPSVPLRIGEPARRAFPQTKLGAPTVELRTLTVDLGQATRFELVCDGPKLVALRQSGRNLIAARASHQAVATALETRVRSKPPVPEGVADLPRRLVVPAAGGTPAATLTCAFMLPATHVEMPLPHPKTRRASAGAAAREASLPNGPSPLPAVVLLGGVGAQDQDGDPVGAGEPRLSILKQLAIRLAVAKIASLRCADRGVGGRSDRPLAVSLDALASDARALVAALRKERAVDPSQIGLIGHGEGGTVATLAAGRDPKLRVVALLAAPARPLDALILEQTEATLRRFGYVDDEISAAVAEKRGIFEALRAGRPLPKTLSDSDRRAVQQALPWLRSHLKRDPATLVASLGGVPVLVAQGGKDVQVSTKDAERLKEALERAGNKQVKVKLYPELTHPFSAAARGILLDHLDPRAEVAGPFLNDVVAFLGESFAEHTRVAAAAPGTPPEKKDQQR